MMEFNPRTVINGRLIRQYLHKHITIIVKIESIDGTRKKLKAHSTDNVELTIWSESPVNGKGWVEVIGKPTGPNDIEAQEIIVFESQPDDEEFDFESHNLLVSFLENAGTVLQSA